ncbi:hypothetical protein PPL_09956 [Heterostelium album PN500]|uniref:Ankyrin repeat protein n=1 Tax=Heterostelium pallidum (strain ATCC 26659 / Pp 5 / PN500) TaxID=670386 RepID=D3BPN1_HETP5|nr:hypothetical protein PPL_09956 [Heterostelium album PN500]EFA76651.1 hypothetical protein PPL_09956 [Heterostelium album PN500]|eukprot:XP_020428783.1 hypothetical protein PPL_09956 [Heterostelium album PN500]
MTRGNNNLSFQSFNDHLEYLVRFDHMEILEFFHNKFKNVKWSLHNALYRSLVMRKERYIRFFVDNRFSDFNSSLISVAVSMCAIGCSIDIVRYVCEKFDRYYLSKDNLNSVIIGGKLDVVKYFLEPNGKNNNCVMECPIDSAVDAAHYQSNEMVMYFSENHPSTITRKVIDTLAKQGSLGIMRQLLEQHSIGGTTAAIDLAAMNGHFNIVQWLTEHSKTGCTSDALDYAAERGHLSVVEFLHSNRVEGCTKRALNLAATNGHLQVVKFLHYNRSEGCNTKAAEGAAVNGHLETLKFLLDNRTEQYGVNILDKVAHAGQLEVLKYLISIKKGGPSLRFNNTNIFNNCVSSRRLEVVKYLHQECGMKYNDAAIDLAILNNDTTMLKYLLEFADFQPIQCNNQRMIKVVEKNYFDLLKILWEKKLCAKLCIRTLSYNNRYEMFKYALDNNIHIYGPKCSIEKMKQSLYLNIPYC